jgi:hypothetical protein
MSNRLNHQQGLWTTLSFIFIVLFVFGSYFNKSVDNLPLGLEYLDFGFYFNQPIDNLPKGIVKLTFTFGDYFNHPIDNLPSELKRIIVKKDCKFNELLDINKLPKGLTVEYI